VSTSITAVAPIPTVATAATLQRLEADGDETELVDLLAVVEVGAQFESSVHREHFADRHVLHDPVADLAERIELEMLGATALVVGIDLEHDPLRIPRSERSVHDPSDNADVDHRTPP
jgi:hypothetical protein